MRATYLGAALMAAFLAGAALATADDPPPASQDPRWRAWTGYEPAVQPGEGPTPAGLAAQSCAAYENENFGGRRLDARDGMAFEYVGRGWDNRISSVACAPGCRMIAYQTIVFGGARANFTGGRASLGPVWNDRISAFRVACDDAHADASH